MTARPLYKNTSNMDPIVFVTLGYLRSEVDANEFKSIASLPTEFIKRKDELAKEKQRDILQNLSSKYAKNLTKIVSNLFSSGRSRYNYIVDGVDFIHHVRTKTRSPIDLYLMLVDLYSVRQQVLKYEDELARRVEFIEINIDAEMEPYVNEPNTCKASKFQKPLTGKKSSKKSTKTSGKPSTKPPQSMPKNVSPNITMNLIGGIISDASQMDDLFNQLMADYAELKQT